MKTNFSVFPSLKLLLATVLAAAFVIACAKQDASSTSTPSASGEAAVPEGEGSTESPAVPTEETPAAAEGESATPQQ